MRTKEIAFSTGSFLLYYVLVSQFILPVMFVQQQAVVQAGWLSLVLQGAAIAVLFEKKLKAAAIVGLVFVGLQLLLQIIPLIISI